MTEVPSKPHRVQATVTSWSNPDAPWPWGLANVVSDGPTKRAYLRTSTTGIKPELGKPFFCEINETPRGWAVISIEEGEEGLPASFEKIQATVGRLTRAGGWGYELVSCGAQGWPARRVMLYTNYLNDVARIAYLKPGALVTVDLEKDGTGYRVSRLHEPLASNAFPESEADEAHAPRVAVAFPIYSWDPAAPRAQKALLAATHADGTDVYAGVQVPVAALRALGVPGLHRCELPEAESSLESLDRIEAWTEILIAGGEEEIDALQIDRVLIEVVPAENGTAWAYHRLLAPGTFRQGPVGEVFDWVGATVAAVEDDTRTLEKRKEEGAGGQQPMARPKKVSFRFGHEALGRGSSTWYTDEECVKRAGLEPGVPATIRIKRENKYWKTTHVHRSIPSNMATTTVDNENVAE